MCPKLDCNLVMFRPGISVSSAPPARRLASTLAEQTAQCVMAPNCHCQRACNENKHENKHVVLTRWLAWMQGRFMGLSSSKRPPPLGCMPCASSFHTNVAAVSRFLWMWYAKRKHCMFIVGLGEGPFAACACWVQLSVRGWVELGGFFFFFLVVCLLSR